jgi:hypothetical protein
MVSEPSRDFDVGKGISRARIFLIVSPICEILPKIYTWIHYSFDLSLVGFDQSALVTVPRIEHGLIRETTDQARKSESHMFYPQPMAGCGEHAL